jgi:class 3 adenylate cyclase
LFQIEALACQVFTAIGLHIHIAARTNNHAKANEVVLTSSVKDLAVSPGLSFTSIGSFKLKGVPGTWQLYKAGFI